MNRARYVGKGLPRMSRLTVNIAPRRESFADGERRGPEASASPSGKRVRTGKLSATVTPPSEVVRMKSTRMPTSMDALLLRPAQEELTVLYYALMFLVVALIAGALGMFGVAGIATQLAWVLFVIGIILLVVSFVTGNRPRSVV